MRSLFLKIFLWFWLTVVLVGLALVVTWNLQPEVVVSRWRAMVGEATGLYAQACAEEIDRYGPTGLANYLQRLESSTNIRASLFDEHGQLITGRPSPTARQLAAHVAQAHEAEFEVKLTTALSARLALGPSGRAYVFVAEFPRGPFAAFRPSTRMQLVRWIVAIAVSGLICYLLTRYLTTPMLRLRTAARQIAAGDLSARAGADIERRRDELGELVVDFNRMADRIESLVVAQKQLISDISHELRSPLARLTVALGLARQRSGDEAASSLDRIERESERLNDMIGKLLTLARLDAASTPPEKEEVSVLEILQEVVADAQFEAQQRNCTVALTSQTDCVVMGSPELLRSAIENVVRNAVRYTEPNSSVQVSLSCNSGWATIAVRDQGPGVPDTELHNVFRPFYRLANARERSTGGAGLGLAITQRTVRLHGGSVSARNAGHGLEVMIQLPAKA
jgi:two-component system, OmpR family, sensor histidine kinase CpxA